MSSYKKTMVKISASAGVTRPFMQLKDLVYKWWKADRPPKLQFLLNVVPLFLIWQVWKRRNTINHGGKMSYLGMKMEINKNFYLLDKYNFPWLRHLPSSWSILVKIFKDYNPSLGRKMVTWSPPFVGSFKYNSDGASKGNPSTSVGAFCIRNGEGDFVCTKFRRLFDGSNLVIEVMTLILGLEHYVAQNFLIVTLMINSLSIKNILDGN